jgi:transposase
MLRNSFFRRVVKLKPINITEKQYDSYIGIDSGVRALYTGCSDKGEILQC